MVSAALSVLRRHDAPMAEVMQALTLLDRSDAGFRRLRIGIAANITVDLLATYLRRHAYLAGVRLDVLKGSYDNLLGDVETFCTEKVDHLFILPFFDNLQASWEAQLDSLDAGARAAPISDYLARLDVALLRAKDVGSVLLGGVHLWHAEASFDGTSARSELLESLNRALCEAAEKQANVRFVETASIVAALGTRQAFDARFYYRGKAPYTPAFTDELARRISLVTRSFGSTYHKVLVLDCDNTLWGGIVGEDGPAGIALDPHSYPGNVFWNVQLQLRSLERQGVLLCLCSKNNEADVLEVLSQHPHMAFREKQVVARRINWLDKATNLEALAAELNLGLDSFVFIDDSAFEVEAVRERLPHVRVFQVPARLTDYPAMLREVSALFLAGGSSAESRSKTAQYQQLAEAASLRGGFSSQEDYLRSLSLKVTLQRDAAQHISRIAELMNKSNQFNLTTRRLMPGDVARLMESPHAVVYSFSVSDRLTDHGLTGVLITEDDGDAVLVHSFLMSCRVIGRGVEYALWRAVLDDARARGRTVLRATYAPTPKNAQVADFFDRLGLTRTREDESGARYYEGRTNDLRLADSNWVELIND
jgi:FkbH-like protein